MSVWVNPPNGLLNWSIDLIYLIFLGRTWPGSCMQVICSPSGSHFAFRCIISKYWQRHGRKSVPWKYTNMAAAYLCNFVQNISTNIRSLEKHADLKLVLLAMMAFLTVIFFFFYPTKGGSAQTHRVPPVAPLLKICTPRSCNFAN